MTENISRDILIKMYEKMREIRVFEERLGDMILAGEVRYPCHLYIGEEAVAVGVCSALTDEDYIFGNHRSHGHYIAKGGPLKELAAEIYCKETGCSKGRGGPMHLVASEKGLLGTPAVMAGQIPLAVGAALDSALQGKKRVSVPFFGDGAASEGVFCESLNFASLKKLPVIFVCENNLYCTHMPISKILANTNISKMAEAFNVPSVRIDGNDVAAVFQETEKAADRARRGEGPTLIECMTYRWRGHMGPSLDLDKGLRTREELDYWMARCPIKRLGEILAKENILSKEGEKEIEGRVRVKVEEALNFARESGFPKETELVKNVFNS